MRLPPLDRRITIQKPRASRGADGSLVSSWADFATVWAAKKDVASVRRGEVFLSEANRDTMFTEWTIRYLEGLDGTERIVDASGAAGNCVGIPQELGRREGLVIVAERGAVQ